MLLGGTKEVVLRVEGEEGEEIAVSTTILAFTPWSIVFRDFLRLLYWFPRSPILSEKILDFFREPFVFQDEAGSRIDFRLEPQQIGGHHTAQLFVGKPSHPEEPVLAISESGALLFLNTFALGLIRRSESEFSVNSDELGEEDTFQYHGEIRRIEDEFRSTGLSPFWVTPEIQRLLVVARAYDWGLPAPEGIPQPLLDYAEEKVMATWSKTEIENLLRFISEIEQEWSQKYRMAPKDSGECIFSLENWIFALNLFGFLDRFLAGVLPTRMPNPVAPILSFLLEHYFITQWESDLWPARRSALEKTYRSLVPFLLGEIA